MKKNKSPFSKISKNLRNLVPYIGVLFVIAGIIGLLFIQQPLKTSQDTRSEATFSDSKVTGISPDLRIPFEVDKTGEVAFNLINNENNKFTKINIVFNINNKYIDTPVVMVNEGSGYEEESLEVQQIGDGYLVKIVAIPHNKQWYVEPSDKSLVRVRLVPRKPSSLFINFDKDRTNAEVGDRLVFLSTPDELKYEIAGDNDTDEHTLCNDSGGTWREFSNSCVDSCTLATDPDGTMCLTVLTEGCDCGTSQCWDGTSCENNPGTEPPPTETPILGCNESCSNNGECETGMRCYATGGEKYCRLATNPTNTSCQKTNDDVALRSCNKSCNNNAECKTGLTCYQDFCRNPENPTNNSCAAPTAAQTAAIIQSCDESCSTNRDCAINLKCHEGECRLATNPSSTSCSAVTKQTVSDTYQNKAEDATTTEEIIESDTPLQKGDVMIKNKDLALEDQKNALADKKEYYGEYQADETLLDLAKNLILNSESQLPFFIILFGVMLLVLSILAALLTRLKKPKYHPPKGSGQLNKKIKVKSYAVKPGEAPRNSATKDLLKTLENQPKA